MAIKAVTSIEASYLLVSYRHLAWADHLTVGPGLQE